jgi:YebC/PmpR family DNA-binding regulatory protein
MAGHSHWKQVKHEKGAADQKRGALFSKLLRAISAAARSEPNPDFNPTLRTMVEKARAANVPGENISRAIERGGHGEEALEPLTLEAYGPEGAALLIEAVTDSKNRTIMDVKLILKDHSAKWAEPGSVRWAFEPRSPEEGGGWRAKFPQPLSSAGRESLAKLVAALETHDDIQSVVTNVSE